jgi:hypothetical protein
VLVVVRPSVPDDAEAIAAIQLASRLPTVGGTFNDTRVYSDGDADYTLTVAVTRVG